MISIIAAYVLAFFCVGWGQGIIGILFLPVVLPFKNSALMRPMEFLTNGTSTFLATYAVYWICVWLNTSPTYLMFAFPLIAFVANDLKRIQRSKEAMTIGGLTWESNQSEREGMVISEKINLYSDIVGFGIAVAILTPLPIY